MGIEQTHGYRHVVTYMSRIRKEKDFKRAMRTISKNYTCGNFALENMFPSGVYNDDMYSQIDARKKTVTDDTRVNNEKLDSTTDANNSTGRESVSPKIHFPYQRLVNSKEPSKWKKKQRRVR